MTLRCLLVDDEPLARERLRALLAEAGADAEVVGEASGGREAIRLVLALRPDVLFLDVQMPVLDGFDVVDLLPPEGRPAVVFVTAYDQYALRAFDAHALDYLTKPVRLERLRETLARLADRAASRGAAERLDALRAERAAHAAPEAEPLGRLTVRAGARRLVVDVAEILRAEAEDKLTFVYVELAGAPAARYHVDATLDELEARLGRPFLRVHRAHLVNAAAVRELVPWFSGTYRLRLRGGVEVPVARRRVRAVRALLGG